MIGIKKFMTICLLTILLVMGMAAPAYALDLDLSDARIDANEGGLVVDKCGGPNHFIKEEGLVPGTTITRSYLIENTHEYDYDLWLHSENPSDTSNGYGLIDKIYLKLYLDGEKIYDGTIAGTVDQDGKTLENDVPFGTIERNSSSRLTATFILSGEELGNEFQGASAEVDWVFTATRTPAKTPDDPTDPKTPIPGVNPPKTGDVIQLGVLVGILIASIALLLYAKKRRERLIWEE